MRIKSLIIIAILLIIPLMSAGQVRYELPCRTDLLNESAKIARSEMGKTERNNRAPHCDLYNRTAGIPLGSPYCISGQYFCYAKACENLKLPKSEIPVPRTGLARNIYTYGKTNGKKTPCIPQQHDYIIYANPRQITGHGERIDSVMGNGWVRSFAFNTSARDPRNGDANGLKIRNIQAPLGRMQIIGLVGFAKQ